MSLSELRAYMANARVKDKKWFRAALEYHRKFSIPFAAIVLGFLAVPLDVQTRGGGKSTGMGMAGFRKRRVMNRLSSNRSAPRLRAGRGWGTSIGLLVSE